MHVDASGLRSQGPAWPGHACRTQTKSLLPGGLYQALPLGSCTRPHQLNSKCPGNSLQTLKEKIRDQYRVRLILDNLPITTYDLELDPESGGHGRVGDAWARAACGDVGQGSLGSRVECELRGRLASWANPST